MPLIVPVIDGRSYEELRDEALRRIPVHNPAWTNFNASDPGVTLVELFAFMTENLLYRSNQIPERNRRKFLSLLGVPLYPATSARGIVTIANERGPFETLTLRRGVEVRAGQVPFQTDAGLDVLPIEARTYVKRRLAADQSLEDQYRTLFTSYANPEGPPLKLSLYQTVALTIDQGGVDLVADTVDGSLWIALLARPSDKPPETRLARARTAIAGRVLNLGVVPVVAERTARLGPVASDAQLQNHLRYTIPKVPEGGLAATKDRLPTYRAIDATETSNVLAAPGVVQLSLPDEGSLGLWGDFEPLESGVGDFPPPLEESALTERLITWIRVQASSAQPATILWAGINAVAVTQRLPVEDEVLPNGTGDPDQMVRLSRRPVVPGSVQLRVGDDAARWDELPDITLAGPEVPLPDPGEPPGVKPSQRGPVNAFVLDAEAGEIQFGDGDHGRRPPFDAVMRASYDVSDGTAGNVSPDAINIGPTLPPGVKVTNPIRTWGGADAESTAAGEKRIARYLQHGERLVTAEDHRAIATATPDVDVGRVEVLAAFDPRLSPSEPGDLPGAVTLMVIPRVDGQHPDAPEADNFFLDAICRFLDLRRLVTSELFLRGPVYVPVWVSVGIEPLGDRSIAETREAIKRALTAYLGPLRVTDPTGIPPFTHSESGWPLRTDVRKLELDTFAGRVDGVKVINGLLVAAGDTEPADRIAMRALQLPRLEGISVVVGDPAPIDQLRGVTSPRSDEQLLPVPVTPEEC